MSAVWMVTCDREPAPEKVLQGLRATFDDHLVRPADGAEGWVVVQDADARVVLWLSPGLKAAAGEATRLGLRTPGDPGWADDQPSWWLELCSSRDEVTASAGRALAEALGGRAVPWTR